MRLSSLIMKASYIVISLILFVVLATPALLFYATRPAASPHQWPAEGVINLASGSPAQAGNTIKVVSYNIGYGYSKNNNKGTILTRPEVLAHLDEMISELKQQNPDIVCLQEVDFKAKRSHDLNQLKYLAKGLGMPHVAYVTTWNKRYVAWPYWPPKNHFAHIVSGQAVLSRFPIESHEVIHFSKPKENSFWYNWFYLDRAAQHVRIYIGGEMLTVWNVHLEAFSEAERHEQMGLLAMHINRISGPRLIVAGDFNEEPGAALKQFASVTATRFATLNSADKTYPSWAPTQQIDYIAYKGVPLLSAGTIPITPSDHRPVWADFQWAKEKPL